MQDIVKWLLNTNSRNWPDCGEILKSSIIKQKIKQVLGDETIDENDINNQLLQTIYFPKKVSKNIGYLTDKLPKSKYSNESLSLTTKKLRASDTFPKEKESVSLPVLKNLQSKSVERSSERKAPPV